ncbi:MAG: phosphate acyltransferase [Candidatus Cloacimonadia bacterium]|jgi:phosphate butyryltransferase
MIKNLNEMKQRVIDGGKKRLAVAYAQDPNTINAIAMAVKDQLISAYMVGDQQKIEELMKKNSLPNSLFEIVDVKDEAGSAAKAVELVKNGDADVLMKGLVSTPIYLKAILDKEKGILPKGNVLTHLTVMEVPSYHKLLFMTDIAVLPFPTYEQKIQMVEYALNVANKFGVTLPKVSVLSATEKPTDKIPGSVEARQISEYYREKLGDKIIIDGPLDIVLSCDPKGVEIKGVPTPVNGDADILVFPNIESGNMFYKCLTIFAGGRLGAMLQGLEKPAILTSRSEDTESKYYSIALGCYMAN